MKSTVALGLIAFAKLSQAGPTGLNVMPTADLLRHREFKIAYSVSGNERHIDRSIGHGAGISAGLFDRVEIGIDDDLVGERKGHVKLLLAENDFGAVATGFSSWRGDKVEPYVVGFAYAGPVRLHLGWWRTQKVDRGLIGIDGELRKGLSAMVEHIAGPNAMTWAGFTYEVPGVKKLALTVSVGFPSVKADGIQHSLGLEYGFRL